MASVPPKSPSGAASSSRSASTSPCLPGENRTDSQEVDSIDALYAGFVSSLPEQLRAIAGDLPRLLGPSTAVTPTWSQVFGHSVTLVTPKLVAHALPHAEPDK